ncbi:hypothetical protein F5I97DRAFT_1793287, partial [Phlebopus sp. FC_14]
KAHRLTIFFMVSQSSTVAALKGEALSALTSEGSGGERLPRVKATSDFELCRAVKDKGRST